MSDLSTPRTVVIVKEQSNWSTQDRWGSYWLLVESAIGMLLGVVLALFWIILATLGASKHSALIAAMTAGFGAGCIILAFSFPYVSQRRPYWYWPMIAVAVFGWISTSLSAADYVCNWAIPQDTLRSLPIRQIEAKVDELYSKHHLLQYAYSCGRPFGHLSCLWYRLALQPAEIALDEELWRRRYEPADASAKETFWQAAVRCWVAYTCAPLLGLFAVALCMLSEGWKVQMSEPGTAPLDVSAVAAAAPETKATAEDTSMAALKSWQKDCVQFSGGQVEDIDLLYKHYWNYATWMKAKPFPNANSFSQAWSEELGRRKIVRGTDGNARKLIGLQLRTDGLSGEILDRMKTEMNGEFGQASKL